MAEPLALMDHGLSHVMPGIPSGYVKIAIENGH